MTTLALFTDIEERVEVRLQDAIDLLQSVPDGAAGIVITDPPYGISYQSNYGKDGKTMPIAGDWSFNPHAFFREAARAVRDGGCVYVFTRWDVYPEWCRFIPPELALKNLIVWVKDNHSAGDLKGNFGFKYECVMMLVKGRHQLRGKRFTNVWNFPRIPFQHLRHPAEKPWLRETMDRLGLPTPDDWAEPPPPATADRQIAIDLSVLEGVHPDDVAAMVGAWLGGSRD
jgi:hypothetical protein